MALDRNDVLVIEARGGVWAAGVATGCSARTKATVMASFAGFAAAHPLVAASRGLGGKAAAAGRPSPARCRAEQRGRRPRGGAGVDGISFTVHPLGPWCPSDQPRTVQIPDFGIK